MVNSCLFGRKVKTNRVFTVPENINNVVTELKAFDDMNEPAMDCSEKIWKRKLPPIREAVAPWASQNKIAVCY